MQRESILKISCVTLVLPHTFFPDGACGDGTVWSPASLACLCVSGSSFRTGCKDYCPDSNAEFDAEARACVCQPPFVRDSSNTCNLKSGMSLGENRGLNEDCMQLSPGTCTADGTMCLSETGNCIPYSFCIATCVL